MPILAREHRPAYGVLFASYILFGISCTVVGATLPRILADFGWDYLAAGLVIALGSVGYFSATYLAGRLIDRTGFRTVMTLGPGLAAAGLLAFALRPGVAVNGLLYFLVGVGQGFIEVAVNWSVVKLADGRSDRAMSLMHGAFALGAVAGPVAAGLLTAAALPWGWIFRGIGGLFLALMAAPLCIRARGLEGGTPAAGHHRASMWREPAYWLGFWVLLLYVGVEMGISNWLAEYFVAGLGSTPARGAFAVSAFWAGLLAGRFGIPLLQGNVGRDRVLFLLGWVLAGAVLMLALAPAFGPGRVAAAFAASAIAGFGCSCMYPITMSLVGEAFPETQGEAMGFASTGGGAGALIFPLATAQVARLWGIRTGYALFVPFAVCVLVGLIRLSAAARRRSQG